MIVELERGDSFKIWLYVRVVQLAVYIVCNVVVMILDVGIANECGR